MNQVATLSLPPHSFLTDAVVANVSAEGVCTFGDLKLDAAAAKCIADRNALVVKQSSDLPDAVASAVFIPVFVEQCITSLVMLMSRDQMPADSVVPEPVGVFEVWEPVGPYEEVALSGGYYGKMERFENVSSFVRFERGTGLPGQVWEKLTAVIHDDLGNHPGFLRAAGASADLLQTAVGIPVVDQDFVSSVVLISSHRSPIFRGVEVWQAASDGFDLLGGAYADFPDSMRLNPPVRIATDEGWPKLLSDAKAAVSSLDAGVIYPGRDVGASEGLPDSAIAIPRFDGQALHSFIVLMF
ncbi:GAF domain-containing protein [Crateriforma spongiae]|uniref:GAF domain-containing protein n=1 Tax=Crateriforma spongiae TaxID=2724528 RepID=UPI0039B06680